MNFLFKFIFLNAFGNAIACFGGGYGLTSLGGGCIPYGGGLGCLPVYQPALPTPYGIFATPVYPSPCYNPCANEIRSGYGATGSGYNPFFGGRRHRKRRRRDLIHLVGPKESTNVSFHHQTFKFKIPAIITKKKAMKMKIVQDFADVPNNSSNVNKWMNLKAF